MNKVLLVICDGWGFRKSKKYNAVSFAKTPNMDFLWKKYPHAVLKASGTDIGLPKGQMGTSESNHLIIGSGRIVYQNLEKINQAIKNGLFSQNDAFNKAAEHVKTHNSTLHIKGLLSDGGVHSHIDHIKSLIKLAKDAGVKKLVFHAFTDGRDTPPKSSIQYINDIENYMKKIKLGIIGSIGGRYWGMDRDNNIDRIEKHFQTMVYGKGKIFRNTTEAINDGYKNNISDEFIEPSVILDEQGQINTISNNDAVIFANFRSDRTKQLMQRVLNENIDNLLYVAMIKYLDDMPNNVLVAFPPEIITNTLTQTLAKNHKKQLKITETEKFTHLTFFFNAQKYEAETGEERIMLETNKDVKTHDEKPQMRVYDIAETIVKSISTNKYDFICTNLVNCDIVGHTGNVPAIIQAVEHVDSALGMIYKSALKNNYDIIVTADHGNAEEAFDEKSNQPMTSHTTNPVPLILISKEYKNLNRKHGLLSDIAPTILKMMNIKIPKEMTGKPLIENDKIN